MQFRDISFREKECMEKYLKPFLFRGCEYSFGNLYIWKDLYHQQVAEAYDMLLVKSEKPGKGGWRYLFPVGNGDFKAAVEAMSADAAKLNTPLIIRGFGKEEREKLQNAFPGRFHIESVREEWDYLYKAEDLALLAGKKYHGKRNHIAQFERKGQWHFEPLLEKNREACRSMCEIWYEKQAAAGNTAALMDRSVVENALCYFDSLGFTGGVLYQEDKVAGFTIGEPLTADTYGVHVEKAFAEINGAYPMLNREYVRAAMQGYTFVNREEDDGVEGLRRAKESYYPVMLEKYVAWEKR